MVLLRSVKDILKDMLAGKYRVTDKEAIMVNLVVGTLNIVIFKLVFNEIMYPAFFNIFLAYVGIIKRRKMLK